MAIFPSFCLPVWYRCRSAVGLTKRIFVLVVVVLVAVVVWLPPMIEGERTYPSASLSGVQIGWLCCLISWNADLAVETDASRVVVAVVIMAVSRHTNIVRLYVWI